MVVHNKQAALAKSIANVDTKSTETLSKLAEDHVEVRRL